VNRSHGAPRIAPLTEVSDWSDVGVASLKSDIIAIEIVPFVVDDTRGSYHILSPWRPHFWKDGAIWSSQGMDAGCKTNS